MSPLAIILLSMFVLDIILVCFLFGMQRKDKKY